MRRLLGGKGRCRLVRFQHETDSKQLLLAVSHHTEKRFLLMVCFHLPAANEMELVITPTVQVSRSTLYFFGSTLYRTTCIVSFRFNGL
jgi:hypothetical protein